MLLHYLSPCFLPATVSGAAVSAYKPQITWVDCAQNVPPPATFLVTDGVNMSALPETLHCGKLVVPMDYEKNIGMGNNITLGLAMYRPKNPKGVVFL